MAFDYGLEEMIRGMVRDLAAPRQRTAADAGRASQVFAPQYGSAAVVMGDLDMWALVTEGDRNAAGWTPEQGRILSEGFWPEGM